jgi:hypothetical protein
VEEAHTRYVGWSDRSRLELEGTADLSLAREEENFNQLLRDIRHLTLRVKSTSSEILFSTKVT